MKVLPAIAAVASPSISTVTSPSVSPVAVPAIASVAVPAPIPVVIIEQRSHCAAGEDACRGEDVKISQG